MLMTKSGKVLTTIFIFATGLIAVSGVFVFPKATIQATKASGNFVDHTITLNSSHVVDFEEDDLLGLSFKLRKENATNSNYYYESSEAIAYEYGSYSTGNDHILVADEGSNFATVEMVFDFVGVAKLNSVIVNGEFYRDNQDDEPDETEYKTFNYSYENSVSINLLFPKVIINTIVISYSCAG